MFGNCVPNHVLVNEYTPGQGIIVSRTSAHSVCVGTFCLVPSPTQMAHYTFLWSRPSALVLIHCWTSTAPFQMQKSVLVLHVGVCVLVLHVGVCVLVLHVGVCVLVLHVDVCILVLHVGVVY